MTKYAEVIAWICKRIQEGDLNPGDKLHTENALSQQFGVSRQTIRQALGVLESANVLERRRGSGTYICETNIKSSELPRAMNVGVISTYTDDYIFPCIIRGIERVLSKNGYSMQLAFTYNRIESERQALLGLLGKPLGGLIVEPTTSALPNPNLPLYQQISKRNIPIVFFNARYPNTDYHCVSLDDRQAGKVATQHFIDNGHRRIAGVFKCDDMQGHLRYAGYLDALFANNITPKTSDIIWFCTEDVPRLELRAEAIYKRIADCSAVLCYNDDIASILLGILCSQGVNVPDDVSVIGIDNSALAEHLAPSLTTVNHPKEHLGETVAQSFIKLVNDPTYSATVTFPATLIERRSVARCTVGAAHKL